MAIGEEQGMNGAGENGEGLVVSPQKAGRCGEVGVMRVNEQLRPTPMVGSGSGEKGGSSEPPDSVEEMRRKFLEESSMELEASFEISEEMVKKGALAKCFGKAPMPRNRVKQILSGIWSLKGKWWMKTMETGLWGIFFEREDDLKNVLDGRPWIMGG
uniref:DUF4283 domain-containing protein n=1 Tax=Cannabis sativa TaxID=3483 RepID=A0A803NHK2_CANSA